MSWYQSSCEILISYIQEIPECTGARLKTYTRTRYPYAARMGCAYQRWLDARKDAIALLDAGVPIDRLAVGDWGKLRGRRANAVEPSPGQMLLLGGE